MSNPNFAAPVVQEESIHNYDAVWKSTKESDQQTCLTVITACEVAMEHLFDKGLKRPKKVIVQLVEIPPQQDDGTDGILTQDLGICHQPYMPKEGSIPGELVIDIHIGQDYKTMAHTVLHELTHAYQIFSGKMGLSRVGGSVGYLKLWEGRAFSKRLMEYGDLPWEIEANKVADDLMQHIEFEDGVIA